MSVSAIAQVKRSASSAAMLAGDDASPCALFGVEARAKLGDEVWTTKHEYCENMDSTRNLAVASLARAGVVVDM